MPLEPTKKFWMNDSCLVCQSVHSSSFEKVQHEGEVSHQKKVIVYDFLKKQLPSLGKVNPESQDALSSKLYERYIRSGAPVIGLDCIFELGVHWKPTPLWICKICYESGSDLESADAHIYSSFHKRNYLSEKHPERFASLAKIQDKSEVHKHTAIEHEAALDVLQASKGITSPPQLYVLGINKWDQDQVLADLALDKDAGEKRHVVEPVTSKHKVMNCHVCGENVMSFMDDDERIKIWNIHCSTPKHQQYQLIRSALEEVRTIERNEQPRNFSISHDFGFHEDNGVYYGPTCGLEFLTVFENECFCKLCCCIMSQEEASKHFRCESHIARFLNLKNPSKLLNIDSQSVTERHTLFSILLKNERLPTRYHEAQQKLPVLLRNMAKAEKRQLENSCKSQKMGNFDAFWCNPCGQYFKEEDQESKRAHLYSSEHFDRLVKRGFFNLDEDFYVNKYFIMPEQYRPARGRFQQNMTTQNHCFFGLEYVIKDEVSKKFICKCCVTSFKDGKLEDLGVHLRSYSHAIRALHHMNPSMISFLWRCFDGSQENDVVLDYLKHTPVSSEDKIRIYDPILAVSLNCQASIPKRFLQMASTEPSARKGLINSEKFTGCVGLNIALNTTKLEILEVTKKLAKLWCQECNQAFTCFLDKLDSIWTDHMFTRSHWTRSDLFKANRLSPNNFDERPSPFFVPAFPQEPDKKKVTWKWSDFTKAYEFVYMRLGLKDVVHRYGPNGDFFCNLCAKNLPLDQNSLERHVRSLEHVFFYVHKYLPLTIPELEDILLEKHPNIASKRKSMRRYIARLFKDTEEKLDALPIYNMKRSPCSFESVEIAVDFDEFALETATFDKQIEKALKPVWHFMLQSVGDVRQEKVNYEKLNYDLSEESSTKLTLEGEKLKILDEVKYNELEIQNNNGAAASSAQASMIEKFKNLESLTKDQDRSRSKSRTYEKESYGYGYDRDRKHSYDKDRDYDRHRDRSPGRHHSSSKRSRSRSRDRHRSRSRSRDRYHKRSRSPYSSSHRHRSKSPHGHSHHHKDTHRHRTRSRSTRKESSTADYSYGYGYQPLTKGTVDPYKNEKHEIGKKFNPKLVGYNTNNKDPSMVRARVFCGFGLTVKVSREDIIELFADYGKLIGVTSFSGYAFIQYTNSSEADLAVSALNGYFWKGTILDVKLAVSGAKATSVDHYKAIEECQKLANSEPTGPLRHSKHDQDREVSISSDEGEFTKSGKSEIIKPDDEKKMPQKIQINLLNRLAASKKKDNDDAAGQGFKIRHAPAPVVPPSLQDEEQAKEEEESLAMRKLKELTSLLGGRKDEPAKSEPSILGLHPQQGLASLPPIGLVQPASLAIQPGMQPPLASGLVGVPPALDASKIIRIDLTRPPAPVGIGSLPLPDFSKPPPSLAPGLGLFGAPPGVIPGVGLPGMTGFPTMPNVPPPSLGMPMPGIPGPPLGFNQPPPVMSQQEVVMKAKMDLYKRDLAKVNTKEELIKYLKDQGSDKIPESDPPLLFNEIVKSKKGILGADSLYQIICYGYPDLETFYCHMCDYWTTVSEIFSHLNASMHRLKYMYRSYKVYHKKAMDEPDEDARDALLQKFAEHIWKIEGSGKCQNRMRCILNAEDIQRIWPDFRNYVDNSWKIPDLDEDKPAEPIKPPVVEPISSRAADGQRSPEKRTQEVKNETVPEQEEGKDQRLAEFLARMQGTLMGEANKQSDQSYGLDKGPQGGPLGGPPGMAASSYGSDRGSTEYGSAEKRPLGDYSASRRSPHRDHDFRDSYYQEPKRRREEYSPDTTWRRPDQPKSPELHYKSSSSTQEPSNDWETKAAAFLSKIGENDAARKLMTQASQARDSYRGMGMDDKPPGVEEMEPMEQMPPGGYVYRGHFDQDPSYTSYQAPPPARQSPPPPPVRRATPPPKVTPQKPTTSSSQAPAASSQDLHSILSVMGLSSDEITRILQQAKPDSTSNLSSGAVPAQDQGRAQASGYSTQAQTYQRQEPAPSGYANQPPSYQRQEQPPMQGYGSSLASMDSRNQPYHASRDSRDRPQATQSLVNQPRVYRRYVPPENDEANRAATTAARVVREDIPRNEPKMIPLDVNQARTNQPSNPTNQPSYNRYEGWK